MENAMKNVVMACALAAVPLLSIAQNAGAGKLPVEKGPTGTVWVNPNISSNSSKSAPALNGGTVGATTSTGKEGYVGIAPSGNNATVSAGGSTGGNPSYSAGAYSDGKNSGASVGVTIQTK